MASPGTRVRRAGPSDIPELVALCLEARGESALGAQLCTGDPTLLESQLRAFCSVPGTVAMLAEHEGEVAGFLLARLVGPGPYTDETSVHLEAIFVSATHRRRGVGHAMLAELLGLEEVGEARHLFAAPHVGARGVQRFFVRLGFASAGGYRVTTVPALLRRLASGRRPGRARGIEGLIARRRVARDEATTGEILAARVRERAAAERAVG